MLEDKYRHIKVVVDKAKSWMVKTWGDTRTTAERRAALQKMKKKIDHKQVSQTVFVACTKLTLEMSVLHASVCIQKYFQTVAVEHCLNDSLTLVRSQA